MTFGVSLLNLSRFSICNIIPYKNLLFVHREHIHGGRGERWEGFGHVGVRGRRPRSDTATLPTTTGVADRHARAKRPASVCKRCCPGWA